MNKDIYSRILSTLALSADKFSPDNSSLPEELKEDFEAIIEDCDIATWKSNVDGRVKSVDDLLLAINASIKENDKQRCVESVAMLRCAFSDIASAFSNATDSMEKLAVSIRDDRN